MTSPQRLLKRALAPGLGAEEVADAGLDVLLALVGHAGDELGVGCLGLGAPAPVLGRGRRDETGLGAVGGRREGPGREEVGVLDALRNPGDL